MGRTAVALWLASVVGWAPSPDGEPDGAGTDDEPRPVGAERVPSGEPGVEQVVPAPPVSDRPAVAPARFESVFEWRAPPGCPRAVQVRRSIERRLGHEWTGESLRARGEVEAAADGYGYTLRLDTERDGLVDSRTMHAAGCDALADAAALVVALSVDPVEVARRIAADRVDEPSPIPVRPAEPVEVEVEVEDRPTPPTGPVASMVPAADGPAEPERARTLRVLGWLALGPEVGALPGPTGAATLGLALHWPRLRIELGGIATVPRVRSTGLGDVRVLLGGLDVRACGVLPQGLRVSVMLCGVIEAGVLRGDGRRAPRARTAVAPTVGLGPGVGLRVPVARRIALRGQVELVAAALRPRFEVRDPGDPQTIFVPSAVSGRAFLGVEVIFSGPVDGIGPGRRK